MSSYIRHSNLQVRANVTKSRREKLWLRTDWKLGIGDLKKESKFTKAHRINVIMFSHYFAVLCSLHSAGDGFFFFFLGQREISTTFAHDGRKGEDAPSPLRKFPSRSSVTTTKKKLTLVLVTQVMSLVWKRPLTFSLSEGATKHES